MTTSIDLSDDLEARIALLSGRRRRSANSIIQEAIQQYVDREEAWESFQKEAETSWAEYRATGQHLTGAEARAWLRTWGTDAETEAPPCHD
jgi:predicted transcriptional regulator